MGLPADREAEAYAAYERARSDVRAGRFAAADRRLRGVLETKPSAELRARCLITLGLSAAERGSVDDGAELCRRALGIRGVPRQVRGLAHAQLALLALRAGDQAQALRSFAKAEPMLATQRLELVSLHLNRGALHLQVERAEAARDDFLRALEGASGPGGDPVLAAKAEFNLGMAESAAGNLVTALRHLEAVAPVLNPMSRNYEAVGESCLGEVLAGCGLLTEAAAKFEASADIFGKEKLRQDQAEMELLWAQLMQRSDPAASARRARQAARRFRSRGAADWALRAEVTELGASGDWLKPSEQLERAESLHDRLTARGLRLEALTTALLAASAAARAGDSVRANRWLRRTRRRAGEPIGIRLDRAEVRAEVAAAAADHRRARRELRAGLDELHEWLSGFGSAELQAGLVGHGRILAAAGLRSAMRARSPSAIFEWFERARVLVTRVSPVRAPAAPAARQELAALRELHALGQDDEQLRESIRRHAWYAPSIGRSASPVGLAAVQRALGNDGLLSVIASDGRLTALVVTGAGAEVIELGPVTEVTGRLASLGADLDMAATDLPPPMVAAVRRSLEEQLERLDAELLGPVRPMLDRAERWVIVPAGAVAAVPWGVLPSLSGRPITLARSATHWLDGRKPSESRRAGHTPNGRPATVGFVTGPRVPRAADEVVASGRSWAKGASETALLATAAEVSAIAERVDVLHVAAHGRHAAENALFSGIELRDGPWFGYDIDQLASVPEVVILSSCELGRSSVRAAEELLGMTTAWLHAGARCVIASPTLVNDDAACELLPRVHQALADGRPPAEALTLARAESGVLAPFACFGSGW